jgi:hypothetical protein
MYACHEIQFQVVYTAYILAQFVSYRTLLELEYGVPSTCEVTQSFVSTLNTTLQSYVNRIQIAVHNFRDWCCHLVKN